MSVTELSADVRASSVVWGAAFELLYPGSVSIRDFPVVFVFLMKFSEVMIYPKRVAGKIRNSVIFPALIYSQQMCKN